MKPDDVTESDVHRAGFANIAAFRAWLVTMKEGPLFHRIEISYLNEPSPTPGGR
jgi:hypothetical protein